MGILIDAHRWLCRSNSLVLALGQQLAWACVALMTLIILLQVFFRYCLNDALPWPEEAARALMIWMTGLAAPTAYRHGGFVSIDMLRDKLPPLLRSVLIVSLLLVAGVVLFKLFTLALDFFQRGFRISTASIHLPWDTSQKLQRAWVYLAMPVCFGGMLLVNIEMLLREIGRALGHSADFPEPNKPFALLEQDA